MRELYRALLVYVPLAGAIACTAVACVNLGYRYIRRRAARQATTEPVHRPVPASTEGAEDRGMPLPPVPVDAPAGDPGPAPRPDSGADPEFGAELKAMNEQLRTEELPLDPDEAAWHSEVRMVVNTAADGYQRAADAIGKALEDFVVAYGIQLRPVEPASSIEVALLRMRVGIREPVGRPSDVDTIAMDPVQLRALVGEDLCCPPALVGAP